MIMVATVFMVGSVFIACEEEQVSLEMRTYFATSQLLLLAYFILAGFLIAMLVSSTAARFIAEEEISGTLLILASKPIRRRDILLGKSAALLLRTVLLEAILLILLALGSSLVLHLDTALAPFLKAVLWLLLYSFLTVCLFGAVAAAFSSLSKNLVLIMTFMSLMVMFCYLVGPLVRSAMPADGGIYLRYHLYYVDLSYHLQNAFVPFWAHASGGEIIPQFSGWFGFRYIVTQPSGLCLESVQTCGYVHPLASMAVILSVTALALLVAWQALERRDIH